MNVSCFVLLLGACSLLGTASLADTPELTRAERTLAQTVSKTLRIELTECRAQDRSKCLERPRTIPYASLAWPQARLIDETLARVIKSSPERFRVLQAQPVAASGSCHSHWGPGWHYASCEICYPNEGICCSCTIDSEAPPTNPCRCYEQ